jgi:CHAD domain-containing protein
MAATSPAELLIRQRLNELGRTLPGAREGDVERLHRARVATRRLREALPVVTSGERGRKLERQIRWLTRALGPVRELDVALLTLDELASSGAAPLSAIGRLRQIIRTERRRQHAEMSEQVARVDVDRLQKRAEKAVRKSGTARRRRPDPKRLADALERASRRAERLRIAMENAAGMYLPDRLHEVRIAVKKLRYALELVRELSASRATARIRTLKEMQDLLGRMNDHEVLIGRVRRVQGSSKATSLRLSSDLDRLVRTLEMECRQLHGQYMASRRKVVSICEQVVEGASRPGRAA